MKSKRLIKFYFCAESLNKALNDLILRRALSAAGRLGSGEEDAERILKIIEIKDGLSALWGYLDGAINKLSEEDREALKDYAELRCGVGKLGEERRKAIKRSVIKFNRRAVGVEAFGEGLRALGEFYPLLR